MQRTERELTDVEMIETLDEIINLITESYKYPVNPDFLSRAGQIGYQIQRILIDRKILRVGSDMTDDGQYKIKTKETKNRQK